MKTDTDLVTRLHDPKTPIADWLLNVMGLRNPKKAESLKPFYDFLLNEGLELPGDVAEFGVYKGDSLLSTALFLLRAGSAKKTLGFDTFAGFPALHENDRTERFEELHAKGRMSESHYQAVLQLREAERLGIYRQHQFQATSLELVNGRIKTLRLPNVILHPGDFKDAIRNVPGDTRYCAVLMDSDLYASHADTLPHCWEKLVPGGAIYLDEYYSLKYPGARIAIDEFCEKIGTEPIRVLGYSEKGEFERWFLKKPLRP